MSGEVCYCNIDQTHFGDTKILGFEDSNQIASIPKKTRGFTVDPIKQTNFSSHHA